MLKLYRIEDGKHIGSIVSEEPSFEVEFTNQAVLVDKDFFLNLLSRPYLATSAQPDSGESDVTVIKELQPEDVGFLEAILGDLPQKGYLSLKT